MAQRPQNIVSANNQDHLACSANFRISFAQLSYSVLINVSSAQYR